MSGDTRHILLVEDNPVHARLLKRELTQAGGNLALAHVEDGEAAIEYLHRDGIYVDAPRPDLILLDLKLPRLDGHEVLRMLKEDEDLKLIPVVMLTTSDSEADILEAYKHSANSYLVKPCDYASFKEMVAELHSYWNAWNLSPPSIGARAHSRT